MTDGERKRRKIYHTKMRIKERFGLSVSGALVRSLSEQREQPMAYLSGGGVVHQFDIDGLDILVVFVEDHPVTAITQDMLRTSWQ